MLKIERTSDIGRFNLVDDEKEPGDDDRYIRQMGLEELKHLWKSIIDQISKHGD